MWRKEVCFVHRDESCEIGLVTGVLQLLLCAVAFGFFVLLGGEGVEREERGAFFFLLKSCWESSVLNLFWSPLLVLVLLPAIFPLLLRGMCWARLDACFYWFVVV